MKNSHCLSPVELTKKLSGIRGDQNTQMPAHVANCGKCREQWETHRVIMNLAEALEVDELSEETSEAAFWTIRHRLSQSENKRIIPKRKWVLALAAALIAGIAAYAIIFLGESAVENNIGGEQRIVEFHRGTVYESNRADYRILSAQPDEIVRLFNGTITVTVVHLTARERFRVMTGDAEIEVVGTAFDVVARDDSLMAVRVIKGVVDVRPSGGETVRLQKGEVWKPQTEQALAPKAVGIPDNSLREINILNDGAPSVTKKNGQHSGNDKKDKAEIAEVPDADKIFARGWRLMRQRQYEAAAADFRKVLAKENAGGTGEDAAYWLGVSLERSGKTDEAESAYRNYLKKYPQGNMVENVARRINKTKSRTE